MKIFQYTTKSKKNIKSEPHTWSEWQDAIVDFLFDVLVIFLVVFLMIRPFFIAPFQVKQQSMEPNVHDSEYILVWKLPYHSWLGWQEYERGDIVVFRPPNNPENYLIKRVIGLPGETVRITGGEVFISRDGSSFTKLPDDYLSVDNQGNTCINSFGRNCSLDEKLKVAEFTVPANRYFVMGDNRLASRDGRSCFVGNCVDDSDRFLGAYDIEGRALLVFFPLGQTRLLATEPLDTASEAVEQ